MDMSHIDDTLKTYRRELPGTSETAQAIDRGDSLADISRFAEAEGLHHLASALFEAQQEELYDVAEYPTERMSVDALRKFRQDIPSTSKTAQAIDRDASWEEISRLAEEEGLHRHQLGAVLLQAGQERLRSKD